MMWNMFDSLRNLVSGLGTAKDPTTNSHYNLCLLDRNQLEQAYRANWVARRVVDAIPEDATREWREWQAAQPQIEKIEALEKLFDVQRKTRLALIRARLYGGAAMVLGVDGSGNPDEPLDYDRLDKDCLRFVVVLNRYELNAGPRIYDAESPWYTRPEYFTIATPMSNVIEGTTTNGVGNGASPYLSGMVKIHPSRVVEFTGNELPDWRLAPLGGGWGDSVLQTLDETLKDFGLTQGGIAAMVNDAKVDIIKIPDLAAKLSTNAATQKLFERFTYANVGKSTLNALLIDKDEEWDRKQTSFSALPDVLQQYMTLASAGAGIPVSRLMGSSPGKGLSTTGGGESDLRNYYDDCSSKQKTVYGPAMAPLDNVLQISALGSIDPHIHYTWTPLYQPDPKQVADIAFTKAQATNLDVQMGLINEDALRRARINQLVEDGTYPGLDDAIDEFGEVPDEPEVTPEDVQAHIGMMQNSAKQLGQIQKSNAPDPFAKDAFDPDEPRNNGGQWTSGGSFDVKESDDPFDPSNVSGKDASKFKAVKWYALEGYKQINNSLRSGSAPNPKVKAAISALDSTIKSSTVKKDMTVYRGSGGKHLKSEMFENSIGKTISLKGFTSTSANKHIATNFGEFNGKSKNVIQYEIHVPKGSHALEFKGVEQELLLGRNSKFRINGVKSGMKHGVGITTVQMELVK